DARGSLGVAIVSELLRQSVAGVGELTRWEDVELADPFVGGRHRPRAPTCRPRASTARSPPTRTPRPGPAPRRGGGRPAPDRAARARGPRRALRCSADRPGWRPRLPPLEGTTTSTRSWALPGPWRRAPAARTPRTATGRRTQRRSDTGRRARRR